MNGAATSCDIANGVLASGAGVQCPNNVCSGFGTNASGQTAFAQFYAFAGGTSGYYNPADLTNGINEVNGMLLTNAQYNAYILAKYGKDIQAQQRKIEDLFGTVSTSGGFLKGGNYNFPIDTSTYKQGITDCGISGRCDNGLHFVKDNGQYFIHLDTANPFYDLYSLAQHAWVDVFLGNVGYVVIPRY